jgi:hypothetical protein
MKKTHVVHVLAVLVGLGGASCAARVDVDGADNAPDTDADIGTKVELFSRAARTSLGSDLAHYSVILPVGPGPDDRIRLHRVVRETSPGHPVRTRGAVTLMHGDFATFESNFAAGEASLAAFLARRDIDVWGIDRRWTLLPADGDKTSLTHQGYAMALADTRIALGVVRGARLLTGQGGGPVVLGGFSRGAHLTYIVAGDETTRPRALRNVSAILPIDIYARIDPAETEIVQLACKNAADEYASIAAGTVESDNEFFSLLGAAAASAPDDPSDLVPPYTNRGAFLWVLGQTYQFYQATPLYHLGATVLEDGTAVSARLSPEERLTSWFAASPRWQSLLESADGDAFWCGANPPFDDHLSDIRVPILYIGAAGGFGEYGQYTLLQTGSSDIDARVASVGGDVASDVGHGDLLFGRDAPSQAWEPMVRFIRARTP